MLRVGDVSHFLLTILFMFGSILIMSFIVSHLILTNHFIEAITVFIVSIVLICIYVISR
jgi:hypothetical protein